MHRLLPSGSSISAAKVGTGPSSRSSSIVSLPSMTYSLSGSPGIWRGAATPTSSSAACSGVTSRTVAMSSTSASTRVVSGPVHSCLSSCSASGQLSGTSTCSAWLPTSKYSAPPKAGSGMKVGRGTP